MSRDLICYHMTCLYKGYSGKVVDLWHFLFFFFNKWLTFENGYFIPHSAILWWSGEHTTKYVSLLTKGEPVLRWLRWLECHLILSKGGGTHQWKYETIPTWYSIAKRTMMLGKQLQKLTYIFSLHFLNSWVWEILSQNQMRDSTVHKKGVTPTKLTRDLHIHIYTVYKKPVRSSYQVKATTELSNRTV